MKIIRYIFTFFLSVIFALGIMSSISLLAVSDALSSSENPKIWFSQSGVYDNAVEMTVNTAIEKYFGNVGDSEFVGADEVYAQAREIITPEWIQENVEMIIDAFFAFLTGESEEFVFVIDVSDLEKDATSVVANILKAQIAAIPTCTDEQLATMLADPSFSVESFDVFAAECIPDMIDRGEVASLVDQEVQKFLQFEQTSYSSKDLGVSTQDIEFLPGVYAGLLNLTMVVHIVLIMIALVLVLVTPGTWRGGARLVASTMLLATAFLWELAFWVRGNMGSLFGSLLEGDLDPMAVDIIPQIVLPVLELAYEDIYSFAVKLILVNVVGAVLIFAFMQFRSHKEVVEVMAAKSEK